MAWETRTSSREGSRFQCGQFHATGARAKREGWGSTSKNFLNSLTLFKLGKLTSALKTFYVKRENTLKSPAGSMN